MPRKNHRHIVTHILFHVAGIEVKAKRVLSWNKARRG